MADSVLVLSGGGGKGAYEVGVIKKLVEKGHSWDLIAGVSVGAINGAFLAQFPREQVAEGVKQLEKFWLGIQGKKSIYKNWILRDIAALWKGGVYNTAPLKKIVEANVDPAKYHVSGVKLVVGATCLETGDYVITSGTDPQIQKWILGSAAFPCLFPPVEIDGKHYVDGGVRNTTPLEDVVDLGADVGDLILCSPFTRSAGPMDPKQATNIVHIALRTAFILSDEVGWDDLADLAHERGFTVYAPKVQPMADAFAFDPADIRKAIQMGYDSVA